MTNPINKDVAAELVRAVQRARKEIDEAEVISRSIDDDEFRNTMKRLLGRSSLDLYSDVLGAVIRIYPDLDPYKKS